MKNKKNEEISEEDITEEVHFEIDKDAFKGPFPCCNKTTTKKNKSISHRGFEFHYGVWHCSKCDKEYLDTEQAKRLENFWVLERLLDDKLITIKRSMNFDGKTYFFRFPKELSSHWSRESSVKIKLLTPEKFLVEIQS